MTNNIDISFNISSAVFVTLRFISKISNIVDFLVWEREIYEILKWTHFWKFVESKIVSSVEIIAKMRAKWTTSDDDCCIALRIVIIDELYHDIKNLKIVKATWNKIVQICKLKRFSALMIIFIKFDNLKTLNCKDINDYDTQFRDIIDELIIYSEAFTMNQNWLIYKYLFELSDFARSFIDRWVAEHESFKTITKAEIINTVAKNELFEVIHDYETQCVNSIDIVAINDIDLASLTTRLVVSTKTLASQSKTHSDNSRIVITTKVVKYCNHCNKHYHELFECRELHSHLKVAYEAVKAKKDKKDDNRRRRWNSDSEDDKKKSNKKSKIFKDLKEENQWENNVSIVIVYSSHSVFVEVVVAETESSCICAAVKADTNSLTIMNFSKIWIFDCDCTHHMTHDRDVFHAYTFTSERSVTNIDETMNFVEYEFIRLHCKSKQRARFIIIHNVLHVLNCDHNLIFFSMLKRAKTSIVIINYEFSVDTQKVRAVDTVDLYILKMTDSTKTLFAVNLDTLRMWHERLEHLSEQNVLKLARQLSSNIDLFKSSLNEVCVLCSRDEAKIESHKNHIESDRWSNDLIHVDVMKSMSSYEYNDARYVCIWLCDKIKRSIVNSLITKNEVFVFFKTFLNRNEHENNKCTRIRVDNDDEYFGGAFKVWREKRDIKMKSSIVDNSQMNELVERLNETLLRKTNTMLKDADLDLKWWSKLIATINLYRNISLVFDRIVTSFEVSIEHFYNYSHLRRIEQRGEALNIKFFTSWKKFNDRIKSMILVDYDDEHIYRMIDVKNDIHRVFSVNWFDNKRVNESDVASTSRVLEFRDLLSRDSDFESNATLTSFTLASSIDNVIDKFLNDLVFEVDEFNQLSTIVVSRRIAIVFSAQRSLSTHFASNAQWQTYHRHLVSLSTQLTVDEENSESDDINTSSSKIDFADFAISSDFFITLSRFQFFSSVSTTILNESVSNRWFSILRNRRDTFLDSLALLFKVNFIESHESKIYKEAIFDSNKKRNWQLVMNEKIRSLKDNKIWTVCEKLIHRRVLRDKWVYKLKREIDDFIVHYKARWVIRDFEQQESLNYNEIFAAMIKSMSYKTIFVIVAVNDWDLKQMNVKIVFLYEDIEEKIYVELSHEYFDEDRVCRLRKTLYDLKQSFRVWYDTLVMFLKKHDFLSLDVDLSVFSNDKVIIVIYVDDLLIIESSRSYIQQVKLALNKRFDMTDMRSLCYYLSMSIERDRLNRILYLSQKTYLKKILQDHDMWDSKFVVTLMNVSRLKIVDFDHVVFVDQRLTYQFVVDFLMYVMLDTRLDLAFAVFVISRYAFNLIDTHWKVVKRIFRYIREILNLRLIFVDSLISLADYSDADWEDDHDTRRFTFEYVFNVESDVISWSSKRQSTVALSTCEAKYMSQTQIVKEVIWLFDLFTQLQESIVSLLFIRAESQALIVYESMLSSSSSSIYSLVVIVIYCDNQRVVTLAKNSKQHSRIKHIAIQQHFVREKIVNEQIQLKYILIEKQIVDELIKVLSKNKFLIFRNALELK